MFLRLAPLLAGLFALSSVIQAQVNEPRIDLWPEGVPNYKPDAPKEHMDSDGHVVAVDRPSLTWFAAPSDINTGTAVVVCPGGGYVRLAAEKEGTAIAQWLNSLGVNAFVLRYRMKEYGAPAPLQDVLRALRTVRSRAAEYHVNPARVGVMGASAGGHLAASAGILFDDPAGKTGAALDSVSARPDFMVLLYPVITMKAPYAHEGSVHALLGATPSEADLSAWSLDERVSPNVPPSIILHSEEDKTVPIENTLQLFEAMHKAGVECDLRVYAKGPHGFGLARLLPGVVSTWTTDCETWLRFHGLLSLEKK
jgi:acetyl esterase/lipase